MRENFPSVFDPVIGELTLPTSELKLSIRLTDLRQPYRNLVEQGTDDIKSENAALRNRLHVAEQIVRDSGCWLQYEALARPGYPE